MAPGANILLVEAASDNSADLLTAVHYASNQPGVSVVSMSWSTGEASFDNYFTTPSGHNGVTYVASSGDNGSQNAQNGFGPNWPAVSPNVLAVGGANLFLNPDNSYNSETAWADSGGGISVYEGQPSYQKGVVTQSSSQRTVPDVSYNAGYDVGVYDSYDNPASAPGAGSAGLAPGRRDGPPSSPSPTKGGRWRARGRSTPRKPSR